MVSISLIGKKTNIVEYIEEEYGSFKVYETNTKEADITVEFVDDVSSENESIKIRSPVSYDNRGLFFHDHKYRILRIEIEKVGMSNFCVTCDVNFNKHFFIIIIEYLIHHILLGKGCYLCHSSAFIYNKKAVLCPAWRNVGKTNILLAFLKEGAQYLGDDWVIIKSDGSVLSIPKRLNLLFYNFIEYPEICDHLGNNFKSLFNFVMLAKNGLYDLDKNILDILTEKARIRISPFDLFKQEHNNNEVKIDYVILLKREKDCKVGIKKISLNDLAYSIKSIIEFEQSHFHLYYLAYKARTGLINRYLEKSYNGSYELIKKSLSNIKNLYEISIFSQHESQKVKEIIKKLLEINEKADRCHNTV